MERQKKERKETLLSSDKRGYKHNILRFTGFKSRKEEVVKFSLSLSLSLCWTILSFSFFFIFTPAQRFRGPQVLIFLVLFRVIT